MGFTKRSDLPIPQLFREAIEGAFAGATALYGSRAVTIDKSFLGANHGDTVTVPYLGMLGEAEDLAEGEAATPEGLSSSTETATCIHTAKAFAITNWARWASLGDPYEVGARQIVEVIRRRWDKALIDVASTGVPSDFVYDATGLASKVLTYKNMLRARRLWGDEQTRIALIAVHSDVYFNILEQVDGQQRPLVSTEAEGPDGYKPTYWGGALLVPSDKCKKTIVSGTTYNYESYLLKEKSLVIWAKGDPSVRTGDDILADADIAAVHHYFVPHRYKRVPGSMKSPAILVKTQIDLAA